MNAPIKPQERINHVRTVIKQMRRKALNATKPKKKKDRN